MATDRVDLKEEGAKWDGEKVRWDLLPFDALEETAKVYTIGAKKYAARNWEMGIDYMRIVGALLRHTNAFVRGERYDPDNGQLHTSSIVWNALALCAYDVRGMNGGKFDDRPVAQQYRHDAGCDTTPGQGSVQTPPPAEKPTVPIDVLQGLFGTLAGRSFGPVAGGSRPDEANRDARVHVTNTILSRKED